MLDRLRQALRRPEAILVRLHGLGHHNRICHFSGFERDHYLSVHKVS